MIRRAIILLLMAGVYVAIKRHAESRGHAESRTRPNHDHGADSQWANEGGANAPASV